MNFTSISIALHHHQRHREADITKERIQKILSTGVNVLLTTGGVDDLCTKYFIDAGAMAVRRCKKADLKRIAKATGGLCVGALLVCVGCLRRWCVCGYRMSK